MNVRLVFAVSVALLSDSCSRADSWSAPGVQVIASPNGNSIARIVPSLPGEAGSRASATILRFSPETGGYKKVAEFVLRNPRAPNAAVLSDEAEFLVTFDDWAQLGRTDNVVVVYRGSGEVLKSWTLSDIFSEAERKRFISSVSSTWWRGDVAVFPSRNQAPLIMISPESRMAALEEDRRVGEPVYLDLGTLTFRKR